MRTLDRGVFGRVWVERGGQRGKVVNEGIEWKIVERGEEIKWMIIKESEGKKVVEGDRGRPEKNERGRDKERKRWSEKEVLKLRGKQRDGVKVQWQK